MVRGFYSAASGAMSRQKTLNVTSNNIANSSTAGYKSMNTVESTFGDHLISRMGTANRGPGKTIGTSSLMTVNSSEYTDFTQGPLKPTGRDVDLAIEGEGFFLIGNDKGEQTLTRDGQFDRDEQGYLIRPGTGRVLDKNQSPIHLKSTNFTVDAQGNISENGKVVSTLYIAVPQEDSVLTVVQNGVFRSEDGIKAAPEQTYQVAQGMVEQSNVNLVQEMTKLLAGQNHFQSCVQIIKIYDTINEISVNQLGKVT